MNDLERRLSEAREAAMRATTLPAMQATATAVADLLAEQRDDNLANGNGNGDRFIPHGVADDPKLAAMRSRTSIGRYLEAAIEGKRATGAEEEFRAEVGGREGHIPYDAFGPDRQYVNVDTATAAPGTIGVNMGALVPSVFAQSAAAFAGVEMPRVPDGQYSVPRVDSPATAAAKTKGTKQDSSAVTFTIGSAKPKRITGRLTLRLEDLAEAGIANFDSAVGEHLRGVLVDTLDVQVLRGSNASGQLNGLARQVTADMDPSTKQTFALATADLAGYLDGKFAGRFGDLRVMHNSTANAYLATLFATNDDSVGFVEWAARQGATQVTNSNMSAVDSTINKSLVVRAGQLNSGVMGSLAVAPIWRDIAIEDPYSDAGSGLIHVTVVILAGDVIIRHPGAYAEWRIKSA